MTPRLRVVHITGCLDLGGQEKLLVEFAKHADRDRFDLRFVTLTTRGVLADELEAQGWPVMALNVAPGLRLGLPIKLARLLREWQADIVHTHNDRPLIYGAAAARWARAAGVLHTKHGRSTGNSRRQNVLTALTARLCDPFVCVSDDCARLAQEQGVPANRIHTLHNGIDTHVFAPSPVAGEGQGGGYEASQRPVPALTVARLCADKDIATLLRAVAIVSRHELTFRLAIAGDGPETTALRELATSLHLDKHVSFLGAVADVPALMRQARMFVLSSISEGMPLTLLEAMASGLPCVATRVGGVPEVVVDGVTGLLVPPHEPADLAAAILRLYRDEPLAARLRTAGRARVEEHFDVRRMVRRYEEWYMQMKWPEFKTRTLRREVQACGSHT